MDIEAQAVALNKKIEKIQIQLTDGTALSVAKRASHIAEKSELESQLAALQVKVN